LGRELYGGGNNLEDLYYQNIINNFNIFVNNTKIVPKTRVRDIITCFLHNHDVIVLWLSNILTFSIISLLKFNNNREGYISEVIESNLANFSSIHDIQNFFNNLSFSSSSSSNSNSSSSSSSSSSSEIVSK
jgi:hypothetical protein